MKERIWKYVLIGIGAAVLLAIFWYFRVIIAYILISAVLSLIGKPLVDLLDKVRYRKFYLPTWFNALVSTLALWIVFFMFFRLLIPIVAGQAANLAEVDVNLVMQSFDEPMKKLDTLLISLQLEEFREKPISEFVSEQLSSIFNYNVISNIFGNIATLLGNIFIAVFSITFITFFFLKDNQLFVEGIIVLVPTRHEQATRKVISSIKYLLTRYFTGIFLQNICILILATAGLLIIGIEFQTAVVIGLIAGIFNVIPYLGPIIGQVFGITIGALTHLHLPFYSEMLPLLGFIFLVLLSVQIIDNFVFQPLIYSSSVLAHPLEIFIVLLIAGSVAGVLGLFLAIPVYTVIRVIAKEFFNKFKIVKRLTENI